MYDEKDLVRIAKRENNTKRGYLVVDPLQGKHVPVRPSEALRLFRELAEKVRETFAGERLLLVGFAETATAIGAAVAVELGMRYIQTTREEVAGAEYLYFTESHSHASEQRLAGNEVDRVMPLTDRIVFVEDEVTTGNTILHIVDILEKRYGGRVRFGVASLLNGMEETALRTYEKRRIPLCYLVKTDHSGYTEIADGFKGDGACIPVDFSRVCYVETASTGHMETTSTDYMETAATGHIETASGGCLAAKRIQRSELSGRTLTGKRVARGYQNTRLCVEGTAYREGCEQLWESCLCLIEYRDSEDNVKKCAISQRILVLGTEEFMYPALYVGEQMERLGAEVYCHATTRSPILPGTEEGYPLHRRYELRSLYDRKRITYIYDLDRYDEVWILTDAGEGDETGADTLINALRSCGNDKITWIRWCEA